MQRYYWLEMKAWKLSENIQGYYWLLAVTRICHENMQECYWLSVVRHLDYSKDYTTTVGSDKKPISNDSGESLGLNDSTVEAI